MKRPADLRVEEQPAAVVRTPVGPMSRMPECIHFDMQVDAAFPSKEMSRQYLPAQNPRFSGSPEMASESRPAMRMLAELLSRRRSRSKPGRWGILGIHDSTEPPCRSSDGPRAASVPRSNRRRPAGRSPAPKTDKCSRPLPRWRSPSSATRR